MLKLQAELEDCHIAAVRDDFSWSVTLSAEGFRNESLTLEDKTFAKILLLAVSGGEGIPAAYEALIYEELEPLFEGIPDIYRLIP